VRAAEELRYLVLAAQREGNRLLAQELRPLGLTPSQAEVLRVLADHQPLTIKGLGELLVCETGTNPSRLVDRLVTIGVVERRPGADDRREVELTLTPHGKRLADRVATIEQTMYGALDAAAAGRNIDEVLGVLRAFVTGLPAGDALTRRIERAARRPRPGRDDTPRLTKEHR
jgi:MarR family transcriptional regulator, organic hydroperoxide resistance regulator